MPWPLPDMGRLSALYAPWPARTRPFANWTPAASTNSCWAVPTARAPVATVVSRAHEPLGAQAREAQAGKRSPSRTLTQAGEAVHPSVPGPTRRAAIIVADACPLIQLAQAGALHLLHRVGRVVVVADLVADAATHAASPPGAKALRSWMETGSQPGSAAPVRVEATETGRAVALARRADPGFSLRGGGGSAVVSWLVERLEEADAGSVVLHEGDRVPRVVAGQGRGADLDVLTTRAFLALADERGKGREER